MSYLTGKPKPLDEITAIEVLRHPIWEWALDNGIEEYDETWQRPIISTEDVTAEMPNPIITLLVKNTEYIASGEYNREDQTLNCLAVWIQQEWVMLSESGLLVPLVFIALPSINGRHNREFVCNSLVEDKAAIQ